MRRPILLPQYPLAYPYGAKKPQKVQVQKAQEKGSDVNLATYLLLDCFCDDYDEAVVLSNDSDLELAVELVASQLGKMVHVINPHRRRHLSKDLDCTPMIGQVGLGESGGVSPLAFDRSVGSQSHWGIGSPVANEVSSDCRPPR